MEFGDYRRHLSDDYARLRAVAKDLDAAVSTCPGWTVDDLIRHVATVYLHKVACMRLGSDPENWPPDLSAEPALELLDRGFSELSTEFDARDPTESTFTWYPPDQTVGFWYRRMALETAVHRVDAELAAGVPTPIAADLAADGIDEFVVIMVGWGETTYGQGELVSAPTVEIRSAGRSWFVTQSPAAVVVEAHKSDPATVIVGEPSDVLLWLWRRIGVDAGLAISGDPLGVEALAVLTKNAGS